MNVFHKSVINPIVQCSKTNKYAVKQTLIGVDLRSQVVKASVKQTRIGMDQRR